MCFSGVAAKQKSRSLGDTASQGLLGKDRSHGVERALEKDENEQVGD